MHAVMHYRPAAPKQPHANLTDALQVADMLDLPCDDNTYDVVIEKGAMDVLFVDNDKPFDPKAEIKQRVFQMLNETHRYAKRE